MDDAELVRCLERLGELPRDVERIGNGDRSLRDPLLERGPFDELHDDRADVAAMFESVDVRDQGMIQGGEHARFALEPRQPVRIVNDRIGKDLDRDLALEARITGAIDLAHATRAECADDFIGAETSTGGEWHGLGVSFL